MPSENELRNLQSAALQLSSMDPVCSVELRLMADCLARASAEKIEGASAAPAPSTANKIALISVQGGLTPRGSWFGSSLDGLRSQIRRAANDGDVAAIVLDIDSPGGTVAGTMETAAEGQGCDRAKAGHRDREYAGRVGGLLDRFSGD